MTKNYDVCVIGAGSAGLSAAAGLVQLGLSTALIEKGQMGGDCLNTGCVPSKALLSASKAAEAHRSNAYKGISSATPHIDFAAVHDYVHGRIATIAPHDSIERFQGLGVDVIQGQARFIDAKTLDVNGQKITAGNFIVAAGSRAKIPPIDGLDESKVLTNESIFDLAQSPEHLIIIGGGPVGLEMAQAHSRLGSKVTLLSGSAIAPKDDPELVEILRHALISGGIEILEHVNISKIDHTAHHEITFTDRDGGEKTINGSHLLIATGRQPNIDTLDLDKAGVHSTRKGIIVDDRLRTSQKHIYAIGDCTGGPMFTHIAGYHAGIVIRNLAFKLPAKVDYSALPWVTYTDPELAQVGMTEEAAREKYGDKITLTRFEYNEVDRMIAEGEERGLIKVVSKGKKILGVSIVGAHAGEIIQTWCLAISAGIGLDKIASMIVPYPTYAEINKRAAGSYFTPSLFSDRTRFIVRILQKLPF